MTDQAVPAMPRVDEPASATAEAARARKGEGCDCAGWLCSKTTL